MAVQRIQHQILKRAVEQVGVRIDVRQRLSQKQTRSDRGLADFVKLRFQTAAPRLRQCLIHIHAPQTAARASLKNR